MDAVESDGHAGTRTDSGRVSHGIARRLRRDSGANEAWFRIGREVQISKDRLPRLQERVFRRLRLLDLEHEIGRTPDTGGVGDNNRPGRAVLCIREASRKAGTFFQQDSRAERHAPAAETGRYRNAGFTDFYLTRNTYCHRPALARADGFTNAGPFESDAYKMGFPRARRGCIQLRHLGNPRFKLLTFTPLSAVAASA